MRRKSEAYFNSLLLPAFLLFLNALGNYLLHNVVLEVGKLAVDYINGVSPPVVVLMGKFAGVRRGYIFGRKQSQISSLLGDIKIFDDKSIFRMV